MADRPVSMEFTLTNEPPASSDRVPLVEAITVRQASRDEAAWQALIHQEKQNLPAGMATAEVPAPPSAIMKGLTVGMTALGEGARNVNEALVKLFLPTEVTGTTFGEGFVEAAKGKAEGAKQLVVDGLMQMGLSPFVGMGAGARQALENAAPEIAQTRVIDPLPASFIRMMLGGGNPILSEGEWNRLTPEQRLARVQQVQALQSPMTAAELLDTAVQLGAPIGAVKAPAAAKATAARVREVAPVLKGERGAVGPQPPPGAAGFTGEPRPASGPPAGGPPKAAAPTPGPPLGEARINLGRIDASESVKTTLANVNATVAAKRLGKHREAITQAETIEASKGALTLEQALRLDPETALLDAPKMTALRDLLNGAGTYLDDVAARTLRGDVEAAAELPRAFAVAGELATLDEAVARNVARGLSSRNILSEAGRGRFDPGDIADLVSRLGKLDDADPMTLAQRLSRLPTVEQKQAFARDSVSALKVGEDILYEVWINSLLSGPQTHAANAVSNTLTAVWAIPERWLAANAPRLVGLQPEVMRGEAMAMLRGLSEAAREALRMPRELVARGRFGADKVERPAAITRETLPFLQGWANVAGSIVRIPTTLLTTEDAFFKAINYRMELKAQAYREAVSQGLEGPALAAEMRRLEASPPPGLARAAEDFAMTQTFNAEFSGLSGRVGAAFQQVQHLPMGRLILPFVRTPTNILQYAGQRTPALNLLSQTLRADLKAGGVRRDTAIAKLSTSAMIGAAIIPLAAGGLITGGGPKDPVLQRQLRATGWQPYSLKVGDTYYSYNRLDPLGATFGILADAVEIGAQVPEGEYIALSAAAALAISKHMTSKTYLEGLSNALEAIERPDRGAHSWAKRFTGSLVPTLVRTVERTVVDPTLRETFDLLDEIKAGVPGWSATLPPRRNLFAEPIRPEGGFGPDLLSPIYRSTLKQDPVSDEIVTNEVRLTLPPKVLGGSAPPTGPMMKEPTTRRGIPLTPEAYDRLVVLTGQEIRDGEGRNLHERLTALITSPAYQTASTGPDGGRARMIRLIVDVYKDLGEAHLRREYPDLDRSLRELEHERLTLRLPTTDPRSPQYGTTPATRRAPLTIGR